jgi:predicted DNA-binding transcriptional regulator AlpA
MNPTENPSRLLTPEEAAEFVGVNVGTLAKWRCLRSDGPKFSRLGGKAIRYRMEDLVEFVEQNRHASTSEYTADTQAARAAIQDTVVLAVVSTKSAEAAAEPKQELVE